MSKIIGVIGQRGSGKTTFVKEAKSMLCCSVGSVRVSDILKEFLKERGLPFTTENFQHAAAQMRQTDPLMLASVVKERIKVNDSDVIFVEGIRGMNVINVVRNFEGTKLVYIDSPSQMRYERVCNRQEKHDETVMTYKRFVELDALPLEKKVPKLKKEADCAIMNIVGPEVFRVEIKNCLHKLDLPVI